MRSLARLFVEQVAAVCSKWRRMQTATRLFITMSCALLIVVSIVFVVDLRLTMERFDRIERATMTSLLPNIQRVIEHSMLNGDHERIKQLFSPTDQSGPGDSVLLLDADKRVVDTENLGGGRPPRKWSPPAYYPESTMAMDFPLKSKTACLKCHASGLSPIGYVRLISSRREQAAAKAAILKTQSAIFLIVLIAFGFAALIIARRQIHAPLGLLVEAMRRVGSGRLDTRVGGLHGMEFQVISDGFNAMISQIQSRDERLALASRQDEIILESISDGFIFLDREWRYARINSGAARMSRRAPEELLGKSVWETWPGLEKTPFGAAYRRAVTENVTITIEAFYPEPLNAWFEVRCYPAAEGLSLFFNDITERKRLEQRMAWLASFPELNPHPISEMDLQGHLEYLNPDSRRLFPDLEMNGLRHPWLVGLEATLAAFQQGQNELESREIALAGRWYQQTIHLVAQTGRARIYGTDITERKRMEAELKDAQAFNESTLNALQDVYYVFDSQGRFLSWNAAVRRVSGYNDREIAAMTPADFIAPDDRPRVAAAIAQVFQAGSASVEAGYLTKDGRCFPYHFTGSAFKDSEGKIIGCVGVGRDLSERKRHERELLLNNAILSAQQEASLDGILVVDENAKILTYNRKFIDIMGIPPAIIEARADEPVLRHVTGLTKDPAGFLAKVDYLSTHKREISTDDIELKDGRFLARYSAPITGPDGEYAGRTWYFRDTTEAKKAAAGLARLATIVDDSADMIFSTDVGGIITSWNPGAQRVFGYTAAEAIGKNVTILSPADDRAGVLRNIARLAQGESVEFEAKRRTKAGAGIDVWAVLSPIRDPGGLVVGVSAIYRDISEHKRRDEAIKQSAAEISDLYDNAPCGYHSLDEGGVFLRVNDTELSWLGYSRDELVGKKNFRDLIPPEEVPEFEKGFAALKAQGRIDNIEGRLVCKDGTILPVLINATAARDSTGKVLATRTTIVDLTEQKRMQVEKALIEAQFLQAQKMEAVGRLAGGVAHDFNNMLTAIKGYSEFLIASFTAEDPRRADAQEILRAGDRAATLTRQLLAFSRRQVLTPRVVDLNESVTGMVKMLKRLLGDDVQLVTRLAADLDAVVADPGQIEQVILNLAINARDAMPKGGTVTIETANLCRRPELGKKTSRAPACSDVMLSVTDTGSGMSPTVLDHLFEPFFTTKPKGKGTGLGLSTVYGIVKQSGGDIKVTSEPGRGSIMSIFLPASRQAVVAVGSSDGTAGPIPSGAETVLLVEDEDSVRALAERTLCAAGYRVLCAADAPKALACIRAHQGSIDLLLSDVIMPGPSGPELAAEILRSRPDIKVLYISGNEDGILSKHGVLKPGVALLPKPFSPETLARRVREVLDHTEPSGRT
jgi:PAS domain S-box-containing protein